MNLQLGKILLAEAAAHVFDTAAGPLGRGVELTGSEVERSDIGIPRRSHARIPRRLGKVPRLQKGLERGSILV